VKQVVISFGLLVATVLILVWLAQVDHFYTGNIDNLWIAVFCIAFLVAGVIMVKRVIRKNATLVPQRPCIINYGQLSKAGISRREGEILVLIDSGLTNKQIADKLFISETVVKKHIANLFLKLEVEQRTDSIKKARELSILL